MSIVLFNEITTEEALRQLEEDGKKYTGLYVDMDEKEQRKYVKDSASHINTLLKKVDRARIDKSKDFKISVESEAALIKSRLETANAPFSALIDAHNEKRKLILAKQKAKEEALEAAIKKEDDHEFAILQHSEYKRKEAEEIAKQQRAQIEHDKRIAAEATAKAKADAQAAIDQAAKDLETAKQNAIDEANEKVRIQQQAINDKEAALKAAIEAEKLAEKRRIESAAKAVADEKQRIANKAAKEKEEAEAREANKAHCKKVNTAALKAMMKASNCTKEDAMLIVSAISNNEIPSVTIRY